MNEIQRRLALIDKQLEYGPAYYLNQAIRTAPLVFCALGMITGIIIQDKAPIPFQIWLTIISLSLIASILFLIFNHNRVPIVALSALFCFACLGAIRSININSPAQNDIRFSVANEQTMATIRGIIETEPYIYSNNWKFSKFKFTDSGSNFYLKLTEAESINGWVKATGLVRVRVNELLLNFRAGDYVQIYCWLDRFEEATNPGEFDIAKYLSRKGVFVGASVDSRGAIEKLQTGKEGLFTRIRVTLQRFAIRILLGSSSPRDDEDGLLLALVLGFRSDIDPGTIKAFRQTGLLHFICLSGMNFAMVIGFIWWVCKTAGFMKPARAIVCMLTAILFLLIVPDNAPAFRAAVMCFAYCGAFLFRRNSNPLNSLALAAIVLLFINPGGLFEPDWQLSFATVLGIMLLAEPINNFFQERISFWFEDLNKQLLPVRISVRFISLTVSAFSVSLAAWLTSAGILLYHFHAIQIFASFWTVLLSPLILFDSILGYLKLIISLLLPSVAAVMGIAIHFITDLLIKFVRLIAGLGISEIVIGKTSIAVIIFYYAIILYAAFFNLRYWLTKRIILATGISCLAFLLLLPGWLKNQSLNLTVLNVGHGQAILAQLPDNKNILFDSGSITRSDVGSKIVSPFLRYKGIAKLNGLVISHGDIDHINGISEIANNCRINSIYASNAFYDDNRQTTKLLKNDCIENNILTKDINAVSNKVIKILWPDNDILINQGISDNDKSVVTSIEFAGRRILLTSDIEKFAQSEILNLYPDLKTDILIAPHHGSKKTLEKDFINKINPGIIINSCAKSAFDKGQINHDQNRPSYFTGNDGAITITINKKGSIKINSYKNKKSSPAFRTALQ